MARIVAVLLGLDSVPGTTVNRYCSSSLQTTRMAFHAIKAGEGDVFVSAGVECVEPVGHRQQRLHPRRRRWRTRGSREAVARTAARAAGADAWTDPRESGLLPDAYIAMGQTAENVAALTGTTRREQDEFAALSQNRAEKALADGFWADEITPVTLPDGTVVSRRRRTPRRRHGRGAGRPEPGVPARRHGHGRQLLPAQRRRRRAVVIVSDRIVDELGLTPLARIVSTGVSGLSPEIMGLGPVDASPDGPGPRGADDRRHRPGRAQRGVRRAGAAVGPRARDRPRQAQRARRRDRGRPPVRQDRRPADHHARCTASRSATRRSAWRPCASAAARAWRWWSSGSPSQTHNVRGCGC